MEDWKRKDHVMYLTKLAQAKVIAVHDFWGMDCIHGAFKGAKDIKSHLQEAISYLDQAIKEEENADIESHGTVGNNADTAASGQPKEGTWGPVGAYEVDQRERDPSGNNGNP